MAPVVNSRHLFVKIPSNYSDLPNATAHDTSETIDLETVPLDGGFLVKILVLSIDPYLVGRMREPHIKSYSEPYLVGQPMSNYGVAVVLRSEHPSYNAGDHVYAELPFQEYLVVKETLPFQRIIKNDLGIPWSAYVGVLGMPGQTAFYGWKEYAFAKKGEVVYVSSGAGPVGATVIQLAKADGCKVIASAGSEEKLEFMKSLGADVVFNYKTTDMYETLKKEGPIHICWDNVGGVSLDAALGAAVTNGRFIECGMISAYATAEPQPMRHLSAIVAKQLTLSGFVVFSLHDKYVEQFYVGFPAHVARGDIKYKEEATVGLEHSCEVLLDVVQGRSKAKSVIVVARE